MGCMKETHGEEKCPYCGFSLKEYQGRRSPRALPVYTILNGKYLIGKVIGEGGFGITYLALDLNLQISLAIKEYFPTSLVTRDTTGGKTETVTLLKEKTPMYTNGAWKALQKRPKIWQSLTTEKGSSPSATSSLKTAPGIW